MMLNEVFTVTLPIYPKDVFRLLALRSITETSGLFERILESFDDISRGIITTPRLDWDEPFSYHHDGLDVKETDFSKLTERQLCAAKSAFYRDKAIGELGQVIDYELPLDDKKDSAFGKVDLVSATSNEVRLLEVKKCESNEHPLRAMFEIFTFWRTLASENGSYRKFLDSYKRCHQIVNPLDEAVVRPGLLLCDSSEIFMSLNSCINDGTAKHDLYRRFFGDEIGMRIYSYEKDELKVTDRTNEIRKNLGIA